MSSFNKNSAIELFNPLRQIPLPKTFVNRAEGNWWIRCVSGEMIESDFCYRAFVHVNAFNNKNHPCFNCPLGRRYRDMHAEGIFKLTRLDTILQ